MLRDFVVYAKSLCYYLFGGETMVDKDKLMQILQKFDVDELWVSFDDLYSADHTNSNDCVLAVKKNATYADQDFKRIWAPLMQFFAPAYDDDDDAVAASVGLTVHIICGKEKHAMNVYEKAKQSCHLVYTKEVGLIG